MSVSGRAVVVGGGIGGVAAAAALHGAGWNVVVLERAAELAEVGAGVSLWPNAVRALESVGPGLVRVLAEHWALHGAAGVRSAGGRWLVRLVDPRAAVRYAGHTAWRAVIPPALAPRVTDSGDTWGTGRRFGYARMGDGSVYWFASALAQAGGSVHPGELGALRELFAGWHEPVPALLAATPPAALLRNDVWHLIPPPRRLAAGRIALLGDAAHAMTPDLGQGACQALEDAAVLAAVVASAAPAEVPAALGRYDAARRPRTTMIMRGSRSIARLAHLQGPLRCALRDQLVAAAGPLTRDRFLDRVLGWTPRP